MELKENHYYLINISFDNLKIKVVKYLGKRMDGSKYISFEFINFYTNYHHNGITQNGNHGEIGKCIYLCDKDFKVLKELSKEGVMLELL